jgi:transcription elongation factor GreA
MDRIYITRAGLEKMKRDLVQMNSDRHKVADQIEYARELGDLKENAEYHAAKEMQALLHARIRDLEDKIARSAVLEDQEIDESKAFVGAKVRVRNKKSNKEFDYMLVGPVEADMASGKISIKSPVGQALLGGSVGDVVMAKVPAGDIPFEILDISR